MDTPSTERDTVPEPILLTVDEAAAKLGVSRRSVYRLIVSGKLKTVRVPNVARITPEALQDFLDSGEPAE